MWPKQPIGYNFPVFYGMKICITSEIIMVYFSIKPYFYVEKLSSQWNRPGEKHDCGAQ